MANKLKTESYEDYLCNKMFKINVKRLLSKPLQLYTIAKYHFTNGENFLYIDFNKKTKKYIVAGTRDFSLHYENITSNSYIFLTTYDFSEARKKFYSLLEEYVKFLYVMY